MQGNLAFSPTITYNIFAKICTCIIMGLSFDSETGRESAFLQVVRYGKRELYI